MTIKCPLWAWRLRTRLYYWYYNLDLPRVDPAPETYAPEFVNRMPVVDGRLHEEFRPMTMAEFQKAIDSVNATTNVSMQTFAATTTYWPPKTEEELENERKEAQRIRTRRDCRP